MESAAKLTQEGKMPVTFDNVTYSIESYIAGCVANSKPGATECDCMNLPLTNHGANWTRNALRHFVCFDIICFYFWHYLKLIIYYY